MQRHNLKRLEILRQNIHSSDRVLIIGASGWFGTTALQLLYQIAPNLHLVGSRRRTISIGGMLFDVYPWDEQKVQQFRPSVVLDFSYLTREKENTLGETEFRTANRRLSTLSLNAFSMETVRMYVAVSSGAAIASKSESYGMLKGELEAAIIEHSELSTKCGVILRPWSVSGPHVRQPNRYAFSDFILQAHSGQIEIQSRFPVFRRYTSVADLIAVGIASTTFGAPPIIDSGGRKLELAELAEAVRSIVNQDAIITRSQLLTGGVIDAYHSDGKSWQRACKQLDFEPLSVSDQIREAANVLIA